MILTYSKSFDPVVRSSHFANGTYAFGLGYVQDRAYVIDAWYGHERREQSATGLEAHLVIQTPGVPIDAGDRDVFAGQNYWICTAPDNQPQAAILPSSPVIAQPGDRLTLNFIGGIFNEIQGVTVTVLMQTL